MEQRLNIITLGVRDLNESIQFYENLLGWQRMDWESDNIAFFKLNGLILSLFPADDLAKDAGVASDGHGFKKFTLAYNARSEKEVDDIMQTLERKNVTIVKQPENVFWGGYSGYFADPDDNLWEVAYNPFLQLDDQGSVK
ncbi:MAG: VOC family protein [Bacteroidetes bacterium]|jgi:catechol 2,3-dioxygenase-like lactoylglutathione lyase family enzyme|nr:VOC family protein [Bacteroidota bacterium]